MMSCSLKSRMLSRITKPEFLINEDDYFLLKIQEFFVSRENIL